MSIRNFANVRSFLLDNKTIKQTIFKNTFWLAVAEGITRIFKLVLIVFVARILGATEYGKFTFALAFVTIFAIFSDFGLSDITIRELSQDGKKEKDYSAILSLKIILSLSMLAPIIGSSFFITLDPTVQRVIWILAIYTVIDNFSGIIYAAIRARQKMQYESWGKITQALIVTAAGFFILFNFPSVENLSYSYLFASYITFIFILLFFHFKIFHLSIDWNINIWKKFLRLSWPLAFTAIFTLIYTSIDSIMMGYWGQITETGWYNAAYNIVTATLAPMTLISISFFPVLSKAFKESKEKLQNIWDYQMKLMIILAIPLVIGGIVLAPKIIDFIYDPSFAPSIFAFQILMIVAGFIYLSEPFYRVLIASDQQKKIIFITLVGAMVNIILNFILIPRYSLYGAAIASVTTYAILLFLFIRFTKKFTVFSPFNFGLLKVLIFTSLATLIMYFVISYHSFYNLHVLLVILLGGIVYFTSFMILEKLLRKILVNY
jgi:O-antigen/teichoic acid export membrane protein